MKNAAKLSKRIKEVKLYKLEEAIEYIKKYSKTKFDPTLEVHINLNFDKKKQEQNIRFTTVLPHGTGKNKKVAVLASKKIQNADLELSESDIEKLEKSILKPKTDFDVLISEPRFMTKLAKAAKVLGPAGVMPNPKNGTVTEEVEKAVEQVKKGRVEVKTEPNASLIHTIIGKLSFDTPNLCENFTELYSAIKHNKPQKSSNDWIKSIYLSATMSPSAQLDLNSI